MMGWRGASICLFHVLFSCFGREGGQEVLCFVLLVFFLQSHEKGQRLIRQGPLCQKRIASQTNGRMAVPCCCLLLVLYLFCGDRAKQLQYSITLSFFTITLRYLFKKPNPTFLLSYSPQMCFSCWFHSPVIEHFNGFIYAKHPGLLCIYFPMDIPYCF